MGKRKYYLHLTNNEYRLINYIIFKNTRAMINIFGIVIFLYIVSFSDSEERCLRA